MTNKEREQLKAYLEKNAGMLDAGKKLLSSVKSWRAARAAGKAKKVNKAEKLRRADIAKDRGGVVEKVVGANPQKKRFATPEEYRGLIQKEKGKLKVQKAPAKTTAQNAIKNRGTTGSGAKITRRGDIDQAIKYTKKRNRDAIAGMAAVGIPVAGGAYAVKKGLAPPKPKYQGGPMLTRY